MSKNQLGKELREKMEITFSHKTLEISSFLELSLRLQNNYLKNAQLDFRD